MTKLLISITILLIYSLESHATNINVGTTLFTQADLHRTCWSPEGIALLSTRLVLEDLLPAQSTLNIDCDDFVNDLVEYFKIVLDNVRTQSTGRKKHIILLALTDLLGGYFQVVVLPKAKYAYYAGTIDFISMEKLLQLFEELKWFLRTNGYGWAKSMELDIPKVSSMNLDASHLKGSCSSLIYFEQPHQKDNKRAGEVEQNDVFFPLPFFDTKSHPSAIAIPFKYYSLRNIESKKSSYLVTRFFITAHSCLYEKKASKSSVKKFYNDYYSWIERDVIPKLEDDKFYAAFGGVLKVEDTLKTLGAQIVELSTGAYKINEEGLAEVGAIPETGYQMKNSKMVLMALLIAIFVWFLLGTLFICYRIRSKKLAKGSPDFNNISARGAVLATLEALSHFNRGGNFLYEYIMELGNILIWNVYNEEDGGLVVNINAHDESILSWIPDIDSTKNYLLGSSSIDGFLKLRNFNQFQSELNLKVKYKIKAPSFGNTNRKTDVSDEFQRKVWRGVLCFDFSKYVPDMFVVALEGGLIAQCFMIGATELKDIPPCTCSNSNSSSSSKTRNKNLPICQCSSESLHSEGQTGFVYIGKDDENESAIIEPTPTSKKLPSIVEISEKSSKGSKDDFSSSNLSSAGVESGHEKNESKHTTKSYSVMLADMGKHSSNRTSSQTLKTLHKNYGKTKPISYKDKVYVTKSISDLKIGDESFYTKDKVYPVDLTSKHDSTSTITSNEMAAFERSTEDTSTSSVTNTQIEILKKDTDASKNVKVKLELPIDQTTTGSSSEVKTRYDKKHPVDPYKSTAGTSQKESVSTTGASQKYEALYNKINNLNAICSRNDKNACHTSLTGKYAGKKEKPFIFGYDFHTSTSEDTTSDSEESVTVLRTTTSSPLK